MGIGCLIDVGRRWNVSLPQIPTIWWIFCKKTLRIDCTYAILCYSVATMFDIIFAMCIFMCYLNQWCEPESETSCWHKWSRSREIRNQREHNATTATRWKALAAGPCRVYREAAVSRDVIVSVKLCNINVLIDILCCLTSDKKPRLTAIERRT